ncbi:hypothetical protein KFZ58_18150 [Virgibacillus sp. NKC19-16]|nr:hypothetical protein [Virgibacillus sp. NKC19-16]UJL46251.1 hypothetical protein KFZ58_18150 [Virgibacillus sp. NKC19-16]
MVNKGKEFNNMFKKNEQSGEHRNGRKSQFKNSNTQGGEEPNEYISKKDE